MSIRLLDCTLRDGGYINDWKFGYRTAKSIIQKLVDSNADYVEVGFLRNCSYDKNATLFNNIAELKKNTSQRAEKYKIHGDGPS